MIPRGNILKDMIMKIGIPRAFLYYRYQALWKTFFENLDVEVLVSGPTTKAILDKGTMYAIDEACLSSKIYLGHVEALIGRCDMIFVPRIANFGPKDVLCTKFSALYDIVTNTFRDFNIRVLDCNIDERQAQNERNAFLALGKKLGKNKAQSIYAYMLAKQAEKADRTAAAEKQKGLLEQAGIKLLIVGHSYNVYDAFIGKPVLDYLKSMHVIPIIAEVLDKKLSIERSQELTYSLPWIYNRELVGAVQEYKEQVDGMILLTAFPCGPDSLVNEILIRRVKGLPILNLLRDSQEGTAGVETRLECFIDVIRFKQEVQGEKT